MSIFFIVGFNNHKHSIVYKYTASVRVNIPVKARLDDDESSSVLPHTDNNNPNVAAIAIRTFKNLTLIPPL
jgi:hypothetical protein